MGRQATRAAAVVAVATGALVGGWATAQQDARPSARIDAAAVDGARLKRAGFVPAAFPTSKPPADHGRFFKRRADGATFEATWNVYPPSEAESVWKGRRRLMSIDHPIGQGLASGKPLKGLWMTPRHGSESGTYWISALHGGVMVDVTLHYARTPRSQGHRWIVKDPQGDRRLVEEITRSLMANLEGVAPMDRVEVPKKG